HLRSASGQDSYLLESPGNLPLLSPQRWLVEARRSLAAKRLPGVLSLVGSIFVFRGGRTGMSFQQGLVQIGTDNRLSANVRRGLRRRPRFRDATGMWSRGTAQRGPRWVITLSFGGGSGFLDLLRIEEAGQRGLPIFPGRDRDRRIRGRRPTL